MKKLVLLISLFIVSSFGYGQVFRGADEVMPIQEDLFAIRKGNQWAFINNEGKKVIDFRNDLVTTSNKYLSVNNGITSVAYEGKHEKSEGSFIVEITSSGEVTLNVYFGDEFYRTIPGSFVE